MFHTSTHTYARLPVNQSTFSDILQRLEQSSYRDQIDYDAILIDLNGLAIVIDLNAAEITAQASRFGHWFLEFCADQAAWSQKTFGADTERGPIGPLKHMLKEVQEVLEKPTDVEEYADLLLLLMDSSRRAGINPMALLQAARAKMRKNKQREWPKPTSDEPVEHVRTEQLVGTIGDRKEDLMSPATPYSATVLNYPNPIWMADLVQRIQEWLDNIYADASIVPICCWSSTTTTDAISIGSELMWDSQTNDGQELTLDGIKLAYQHHLEDTAMPLLKDRL